MTWGASSWGDKPWGWVPAPASAGTTTVTSDLTASYTIRAAIEKAELIQRAEEAFSVSEQKPVAWMWSDGTTTSDPDRADGTWTPLYTAPRQWVGLTDEEIDKLRHLYDGTAGWTIERFARAIEAKLKEKNK